MLYTKIFLPKYRSCLRGITYLVFFAFLMSLNSCYTVSEETITPEELKSKKDYKVLEVKMKSDTVINLENYGVMYNPKSNKLNETLICEKTDTIVVRNNQKTSFKFQKTLSEIKLDSVSKIKIESTRVNATVLFITVVSVVIGIILIFSLTDVGKIKVL